MENKKAFDITKITKTKGFSSFTSALLAIFLGLVFGFIVMLAADAGNAIAGFSNVMAGGFKRLGDVLYFATPIMMTGLAVGFAFKMGLFNIGASGQYTMGMFFALYVGFMVKLPGSLHWIAAIAAGMVGGNALGDRSLEYSSQLLNVNEVITSIMFNYIGMYLIDMLIQSKWYHVCIFKDKDQLSANKCSAAFAWYQRIKRQRFDHPSHNNRNTAVYPAPEDNLWL